MDTTKEAPVVADIGATVSAHDAVLTGGTLSATKTTSGGARLAMHVPAVAGMPARVSVMYVDADELTAFAEKLNEMAVQG
jgi:hypothetical protein